MAVDNQQVWRVYIATLWVFNEESGWDRFVIRQNATSPDHFKKIILDERADDEVYLGQISVSKNQEW